MAYDSPIKDVKGVGDALAEKFALLGVHTVGDLINYYPRRYEDYSTVTPISKLKPGPITIEAEIKQAKGRYVRRGLHITEAVASDESGSVRLTWFNQPYRAAALKSGQSYFISGQYERNRQRFSVLNPSVEMASDFPVNTARILAVYRETKGLTSRQVRQVVKQIKDEFSALPETLPLQVITSYKLMGRAEALRNIHLPESPEQLERAKRRLGFEEVFGLSLASLLNKQENMSETSLAIPFEESLAKNFVKHLPFSLTDAQRRTIWQLYLDMQKKHPMNRLVEGDVGSGKTVVATMAALMALNQGWQVAFMAPTELLARQHAETIHALLEPLGYAGRVGLLIGSLNASQKKEVRDKISSGEAALVVGTHALIQEKVDMHKLALIVVDEQHRFGVEQRKALMAKAGHMPHVLSLTATPIPRSLALTLYGELDISVLADKPPGRSPIITEIISPNSRAQLYAKIDSELEAGRQMFVVCPLIADSEALEAQSVEKVYDELRKKDFKHRRLGLLHGKMKAADKQAVMQRFVEHKLDILVSTTVIEVGVDVPNATIMMIENPERFGLAQLHQLRGRVGRGKHQGYCYLVLGDSRPPSPRLRALATSSDGFRLAEMDLDLRGPGAIYGTSQHGQLDLRIAKLSDTKLIAAARSAAAAFIDSGEDLLKYSQLAEHITKLRAVTNLN
ncbi:MAG TPA: ATP-dependent DNA helicase RecG [Candidatus Saccharimonadales bacterium]|nr:ATP-dependent DNA helicase RecG [Candidatus Saccharimonadales bacterium]